MKVLRWSTLLVLTLFSNTAWTCAEDSEPWVQGAQGSREPSSVYTIEKFRIPNLVEPRWYRTPQGLSAGQAASSKPIQVFRWSIRKTEAPSEGTQSNSVSFERRSFLRN